MADELSERFAPPGKDLNSDIMSELQNIMQLHSIDAQELFYKWESYSIKMGAENASLDIKTARDFKKDLQDSLEREMRSKTHTRQGDKKAVNATPRAGANPDVFGMLDGLVPNTPHPAANVVNGSTKRRSNFETPATKVSKTHAGSSPTHSKTPATTAGGPSIAFDERPKRGEIEHTINNDIAIPEPSDNAPEAYRFEVKARTDMAKFSYKTMALKLSEASEVLNDRIEGFVDLLIEKGIVEESAIGDPASQSTSEIVAVGRISTDGTQDKLTPTSIVLETSRVRGAGRRIPLDTASLKGFEFFPGKIVAVRGTNANGEYFTVSEVIFLPLPTEAACHTTRVDEINSRMSGPYDDTPTPLNIMAASGPYTTDLDLDFAPLSTLLDRAVDIKADALLLIGPFIDAEHPLVRTGSYPPPPSAPGSPAPTIGDLFRQHISTKISAFINKLPTCQVIFVPSLRDATSRHAAFPQDRLAKKELGLPKQVHVVTNPMTVALNEIIIGMSSLDILSMIRSEECVNGLAKQGNIMERGPKAIIEQRNFCPVFPPMSRDKFLGLTAAEEIYEGAEGEEAPSILPIGAVIDTSYIKLAEFSSGIKPDILVLPSILMPFTRIVDNVVVINPGSLAKRRGYGTYARITILPRGLSEEERESGTIANKVFERARVDITRI